MNYVENVSTMLVVSFFVCVEEVCFSGESTDTHWSRMLSTWSVCHSW